MAKQHYQRRLLVRSLVLPILAREGCCCCCCEAANLGIGIGSTKLESSQSSSSSSSVVLVVVVDVVVVAVVAVPPSRSKCLRTFSFRARRADSMHSSWLFGSFNLVLLFVIHALVRFALVQSGGGATYHFELQCGRLSLSLSLWPLLRLAGTARETEKEATRRRHCCRRYFSRRGLREREMERFACAAMSNLIRLTEDSLRWNDDGPR